MTLSERITRGYAGKAADAADLCAIVGHQTSARGAYCAHCGASLPAERNDGTIGAWYTDTTPERITLSPFTRRALASELPASDRTGTVRA